MKNFHSHQAIMPHFSGHSHSRQLGSGFGSLTLGVGRCISICKNSPSNSCSISRKTVFRPKLTGFLGRCYEEKIFETSSRNGLKRTIEKQIGVGVRKKTETVDENASDRGVGQFFLFRFKFVTRRSASCSML